MPQWNEDKGGALGTGENVRAFCCPASTVSDAECRAGPLKDTSYVQMVHSMCPGLRSFPADDGLRQLRCTSSTKYHLTFLCPNKPPPPPRVYTPWVPAKPCTAPLIVQTAASTTQVATTTGKPPQVTVKQPQVTSEQPPILHLAPGPERTAEEGLPQATVVTTTTFVGFANWAPPVPEPLAPLAPPAETPPPLPLIPPPPPVLPPQPTTTPTTVTTMTWTTQSLHLVDFDAHLRFEGQGAGAATPGSQPRSSSDAASQGSVWSLLGWPQLVEALPSLWGWRPAASSRSLVPALGPLGQPFLVGLALVVLIPLLVASGVLLGARSLQRKRYEELPSPHGQSQMYLSSAESSPTHQARRLEREDTPPGCFPLACHRSPCGLGGSTRGLRVDAGSVSPSYA